MKGRTASIHASSKQKNHSVSVGSCSSYSATEWAQKQALKITRTKKFGHNSATETEETAELVAFSSFILAFSIALTLRFYSFNWAFL